MKKAFGANLRDRIYIDFEQLVTNSAVQGLDWCNHNYRLRKNSRVRCAQSLLNQICNLTFVPEISRILGKGEMEIKTEKHLLLKMLFIWRHIFYFIIYLIEFLKKSFKVLN
jgi:hypothetical protein